MLRLAASKDHKAIFGAALSPVSVDLAGQAGMAAIRAGDPATAKANFQSIVPAGASDTADWLALSTAYMRPVAGKRDCSSHPGAEARS